MDGLREKMKIEKFSDLLSERAKDIKASEIREILKLTQMPDVISFAGGLPNPLAFPINEINEINKDILKDHANEALQYGTTEGYTPLREELSKWMAKKNIKCTPDNILITHGSQQSLDLLSRIYLNADDIVMVGAPTYLGGSNAYNAFQAHLETVPLEDDGWDLQILDAKLRHLHRHNKNLKLMYLIPNFQNPSGVSMSLEKRKEVLDIASEYDMLIIEDDPYGDLRYVGEHIPSIKSMDTEGRVVYLSTFSKIFCPGYRIAWTVADEEIIQKLTFGKQSVDLNTNTYGQVSAFEFMKRGYLEPHIKKIKALYGRKQKVMLDSMARTFDPEKVRWTKPEGGMFTWATLPDYMSSKRMFKYAIAEKVAYVTGNAFFPTGGGDNDMRLNFTHPTDEKIEEGVKRLWKVIQSEMTRQAQSPMIELVHPLHIGP